MSACVPNTHLSPTSTRPMSSFANMHTKRDREAAWAVGQQKRQVNMMAVRLLGFDSNMQNQIQACGPCASVLCISLRPVCRQMHASVLVKKHTREQTNTMTTRIITWYFVPLHCAGMSLRMESCKCSWSILA